MNKEEIINNNPSLCWTCRNRRRAASDENTQKGYVGCAEYARTNSFNHADAFREVAEGWVDLRSVPFSEKSGIITNFQMLSLKMDKCSAYEYDDRSQISDENRY